MHLAGFFRLKLVSTKKPLPGMIVMGKFLLILLMLATTNTFAAIIKWVDDQGQVHYSDQVPPPGTQPKRVRQDSQDSPSSSPSATKTIAEREADLKKEKAEKQSAADKAAQQKAALDALKANCTTAQQNLRSLQSGVRIMEIDANGEKSYIDDAVRQQRIDKAQQDIENYCK
jgi:PDZ domain-containing secreted protein